MSDEEVSEPGDPQEVSEPGDTPAESEPEASAAASGEGAEAEGTTIATSPTDGAPSDVVLYEQGFHGGDPVKDRFLLPLLLPLLSMAAIFVFVLNLSRVFLAAGNGPEAWIIAGIVTLVILVGAAALSASPQLRSSTLFLTVATFLVIIGGAGVLTLGPSEPHDAAGEGGFQEPEGDPQATLEVDALGSLKFQSDAFTSTSGILQIDYVGTGTSHTLAFKESEFAGFLLEVAGTETDSGKVQIEPGDYEIYCTLPGHEAAGMRADLTITQGAEAPAPPEGEGGEPGASTTTTTAP